MKETITMEVVISVVSSILYFKKLSILLPTHSVAPQHPSLNTILVKLQPQYWSENIFSKSFSLIARFYWLQVLYMIVTDQTRAEQKQQSKMIQLPFFQFCDCDFNIKLQTCISILHHIKHIHDNNRSHFSMNQNQKLYNCLDHCLK